MFKSLTDCKFLKFKGKNQIHADQKQQSSHHYIALSCTIANISCFIAKNSNII